MKMVDAVSGRRQCFVVPVRFAMRHTTLLISSILCLTQGLTAQRTPPATCAPGNPTQGTAKSADREVLAMYCTPGYTVGSADGDRIDGVLYGTIITLGAFPETSLGYTDFSYDGAEQMTQVERDQTQQMVILAGPYAPPSGSFEQYKVWIDFDQDGEFGPFEEVVNVQTTTSNANITADIYIPADARPGYTGMRVRCVYNDADFDACSAQNYGETEDYTILINGNLPCIPYTSRGPYGDDFIGGVAINGIAYTNNIPPPHAYATQYHHGAHVRRNETTDITITSAAYPGDDYAAWADWNMDGDFDDSGEQLGAVNIASTFTPASFSVTVPPDAEVGYTRLRVRCAFNSPAMTACSFADYGETIDFTLTVLDGVYPCLPATHGTPLGDGFTTVTFDGTTYAGTQQWPYYTLATEAHRALQGDDVPVNIIASTYIPETYDVWLDMNDNGDFSDPGEGLGSIGATTQHESLGIIAAIPPTCPPGQHILRVRGFDPASGNPDACGDFGYGEVLDIPMVVEGPTGVCIPHLSVWTRAGDYIDGVELGDISNLGSGQDHGAPYSDLTPLSTVLNIGDSYTLSLTGGAYSGDNYHAWIDYNADGDWDDTNEAIGMVVINGVNGTGVINFTVPVVSLGTKRLRLRCSFQVLPDACADGGFGETEDYTVVVSTSTGIAETTVPTFSVLALLGADAVQLHSTAQDPTNFTLMDATGRTLATGRLNGTTALIPMTGAANGVYMLLLNGTQAVRFMWEKL